MPLLYWWMKLHDKCDDCNYNNLSYCFAYSIPSRDRSINDSWYSSFSQPKIKNLLLIFLPTIAMFAKMEGIPPQN